MKDLAEFLGPDSVFFISQDDKARVPLGLPASNKQVRIAMHLQYIIHLPDHDWVVGERHKLIPSVYAACEIKDKLTCNGPTYIAVRSGKHDHSNSASHLRDFNRLLELEVINFLNKKKLKFLRNFECAKILQVKRSPYYW